MSNLRQRSKSSLGDEESSTSSEYDIKDEPKLKHLSAKETTAVNRGKILVYLTILLAAIAVGTSTYLVLDAEEQETMNVEFTAMAREVDIQCHSHLSDAMVQLRELSIAVTSHALNLNTSWPNCTLPFFDSRVAEARLNTGLEIVAFAPLLDSDEAKQWEQYARWKQSWIAQDLDYRGLNVSIENITTLRSFDEFSGRRTQIQTKGVAGIVNHLEGQRILDDYFVPLWQISPVPIDTSVVALDLATHPIMGHLFQDVVESKAAVLGPTLDLTFLYQYLDNEGEDFDNLHPRSVIVTPVFDDLRQGSNVVAFVIGTIKWDDLFQRVFRQDSAPVIAEVVETCGEGFSYLVNGTEAEYLGLGSAHNPKFESHETSYPFAKETRFQGGEHDVVHCNYTLSVFPTDGFTHEYSTNKPMVYTIIMVSAFFFTVIVFIAYDCLVHRRQSKLLATAQRTDAIVSSLFPKDVQERMMEEAGEKAERESSKKKKSVLFGAKSEMSAFLNDDLKFDSLDNSTSSEPIASYFPEATIMFADIRGFTAWSSTREPGQIFTLLENIYGSFDRIAKAKRVYKVETIGDCYVAVVGLPEPRKDHAVVMARFARDCIYTMNELMHKLEATLGPDTTDLAMRVGIHSGPVTAGVLRGERARFQLFGDAMNTCSRIETNGQASRVHMSQETADLIIGAGKEHWVVLREDKIFAKGKGELQTYWLNMDETLSGSKKSCTTSTTESSEYASLAPTRASMSMSMDNESEESDVTDVQDAEADLAARQSRLVNWNTEVLTKLLCEILARRPQTKVDPGHAERLLRLEQKYSIGQRYILDEVEEIITLPKFDAQAATRGKAASVELSPVVATQLHDFVRTIAAMYHNDAFHSYEHASHVTMSVVKLLARIVAPEIDHSGDASALHDHTYGITSDPLTQFAVAFSALIHDLDHPGVPNAQLVKEGSRLASVYQNKSVAEQNSVELAWQLLMDRNYIDLRHAIYSNESELKRFRQLVVNTVMATDILDKDLGMLRKKRWDEAFSVGVEERSDTAVNRKATIVIEHLIQASDVAHTMQHWHIYRKWNARLFEEMYSAFSAGRADRNPADGWYAGEIGFFDFYVIPLAKKLKDCGVFGVASDEYLNYALQNRKEWEAKGREIVAEMVASIKYNKLEGSFVKTPLKSLPPRKTPMAGMA